ncbi:MAG: FkbM family methyltransferase [Planctomycetota bacterium]|jgi:FkbM family methyltransferase
MDWKRLARSIAAPIRIPIRDGPAAGMKFSLASRTRFLRGSYERRMAEFVATQIRPGDVFWDVGAHFGYYTLVAANAGARVHAFEPDPDNRKFLERHVRWNRLDARVHAVALGENDGTATFGGGRGSGGRSIGGGSLEVEVRRADALVESGAVERPDFVKIDVQGAEESVLRGARAVLSAAPIGAVMATHGRKIRSNCVAMLAELGYEVRSSVQHNVIVAFGPGRPMPDIDVESFDM